MSVDPLDGSTERGKSLDCDFEGEVLGRVIRVGGGGNKRGRWDGSKRRGIAEQLDVSCEERGGDFGPDSRKELFVYNKCLSCVTRRRIVRLFSPSAQIVEGRHPERAGHAPWHPQPPSPPSPRLRSHPNTLRKFHPHAPSPGSSCCP